MSHQEPFTFTLLPKGAEIDAKEVSAVFLVGFVGNTIVAARNERGWDIPGGHLNPREELLAGLRREAEEEAGVSFQNAVPYAKLAVPDKNRAMVFFASNSCELHEFTPKPDALEREEISRGIYGCESFARIARRIGRPTSTVSREVWGQVKYAWCYQAARADRKAKEFRKHGRQKKLDVNSALKEYVHKKLTLEWSPEEIAQRIKKEYPLDKAMRVSHETIYQHLYCLPKGELKKELMKGLRHERKMRQPRQYLHYRRQRIQDIVSISERPEEARDRTVPGHWEGDLIVGKQHASALGTLVERATRLTLLVPLKKKDAMSVRMAFASAFKRIPLKFKKSLTYDRGSEMSEHALFTKETKIQVYFADPYAPWQRGTNENTNGLIRQYFPKGIDFNTVPLSAIKEAEQRLNSRTRKTLDFYTPSEKFYQLVTGRKIALGT